MANNKGSSRNSSPIKSWVKIAAGSTKTAFQEYMKQDVMPVTAEMAKDLTESFKKTKEEHKQSKPRKQKDIFKSLMSSPMARNLKSVVSDGWKEVKRGNIFMVGAAGSSTDEDFDFGGDDDYGGSTVFGEDSANAEMASGYDEIGDRISDQTEATYKAAEVSMNATIMSSSAVIESQEKIGATIVSRLENINSSMNNIAQTQMDKMEKFFQSVTKEFDKMNLSERRKEVEEFQNSDSIFKKDGTGRSAGLNLPSYKKRLIYNLKNTAKDLGGGSVGLIASIAQIGIGNLTPEVVGSLLATDIMSKAFANNIAKLGKQIETTVSEGIPRLIVGLTDIGNNSNSGKFAQMIGKIFGIDMSATLDRPEVKFEGRSVPFDDQTKAAIVNVIPKHLSEISEYTKALAQKVVRLDDNATKKLRGKAEIFDMDDGLYKTREALTKEIFGKYYDTIGSRLTDSEFGKGMKGVVRARTSNIKGDDEKAKKAREEIEKSYDTVMKQVAMFLYANNNKGVDLRQQPWLEELGDYLKTQQYTKKEIKQLIGEIGMVAKKESVANQMGSVRYDLFEAGKEASEALKKNPNLVDTSITNADYSEMNMAQLFTELYGLGDRRFRGAGFNRRESSGQVSPSSDINNAGFGYNPRKNKKKRGGRGSRSDRNAANSAALRGNPRNERLEFNGAASDEDRAVDEYLGTQGRFEQEDSTDRMTDRLSSIGNNGKQWLVNVSRKFGSAGVEVSEAIFHGDTDKALKAMLGAISTAAVTTGEFIQKSVIDPASKFIFGRKNDTGYREGGMLSGVSNRIHDMMQSVSSRIDGKEWTDSKGKVHKPDNPEDSIIKKAKATLASAVNSFKDIFTDHKESPDNEESVIDSIKTASKDLFSSARRNFESLLYGKDFANLSEEEKEKRIEKVQDDIADRTTAGIKGGLIGAGTSAALGTTALSTAMSSSTISGLLGHSVIGTAILNPLVGAGIGFTVGFLSKSEAFQRFFFGGEYTDKNGETQWREGLVSKKMQDYFKKNETTIGVSGAIGAGASLVTGSKFGWLGSILGGPLAGASIGITTALVAKSDAFHTFLFGDEEKGIAGIKQQWAKLTDKMGRNKNGPSITAAGLKTVGMSATGAGAMLLSSKMGLLPGFFSSFGPGGLALLGMAGGITLAHKNLNEFLFGKDFVNDEGDVERKEGIIGKFTNALKVTLLQPVANVGKSLVRTLNYQITHNVLAPLRVAFYPVANFTQKLMKRASDKASKLGNKVSKGIDKYLLNPMKLFVRAITRPIVGGVKLLGAALKGGITATGAAFGKAVNATGKLASLSMTDDEKRDWERQRQKAKDQKAEGKAKLAEEKKKDKRANKDRNLILKYTGGDYGDDTAEARRIAEKRAGHPIIWKNAKPVDGWYTGAGSQQKNKFDASTSLLSGIKNKAADILTWLEKHAVRRNDPTTGHADGIDKVPEGETYVANENSTLGRREAIQIPKADGKGSMLVEGREGSFVVHNGGGERVYNGTELQPIPVLVSAYSENALSQQNGTEVKVSEVSDEAKKETTEAINNSEAVESNSISDKFKNYSTLFGKSIFGPDWEPKKGGLHDIMSAIGDTLGAILTPFMGAIKAVVGISKMAFNVLKVGRNIIKAPFKLGKWAGKKIISGGKKIKGFISDHATKKANGEGIDIGATVSSITSSIGDSIASTANTIHGNRSYAKIRKLITSGNSFYTDRFELSKDEDGREHIIAKKDVTFDDGTTVKAGEELKDALGAGNLLKRTEKTIANRAKRRLENAKNGENKERENATVTDANPEIAASLEPTNTILENILESVQELRYNPQNSNSENSTLATSGPDLPEVPDGSSESETATIPGVTDILSKLKRPSKQDTDGKASTEEGSAKVIQAKKEEEKESDETDNREDENNASLKQLVENSEDQKKTRESWFGKKGKLIKILGIGAIALFALYKFIGGKGLKSLLSNTIGAIFGSTKQFIGDAFYGADNLTDQNDLATNIKEMDAVKVAADSTGGFGLKTRIFASGMNGIIKTGEEGVKAGLKAVGADAKNGAKSILHWKNPFTQVKTAKNSSMNSVSKAANKALASRLDRASANLSSYVAKAESSGAKTVSEAFTNFVTSVVKKAGGEAAETAAENATKSGVFKELLNALKLKAAKIMAKVSGSKFAKGVAAVVTFGLSEAGFAVLGGLNGATGAAKLFHVDKEDVDPLMIAISAAMGAFTSTLVGSIMDAAASIVAEATGMDLLCEVASFVYRLLGDDTKLDNAREKFRQGYEDYKDEELQKQYKTYMAANSKTVGSDYTYEDFVADVESGNKSAKLDSEITYNNKKNKSFFDKVGNFAVGTIKGAGSVATTVGTGIFGATETVYVDNDNEVIYRQQGKQWYAFKWTGKVLVSVGMIDEDNIPDSAIAIKCKKANWFDKGRGIGDEVNSLPKRYGWEAWSGTEINTETGEAIKDEDDIESGNDNDTSDDSNATLDDKSKPEVINKKESDSKNASAKFDDQKSYFADDDTTTLWDIQGTRNSRAAAYATIARDAKMREALGDEYNETADKYTADKMGKKYERLADNFQGDWIVEEAKTVKDADELHDRLKDYALYIRNWDTGKFNAGFLLVHPSEKSFIRFTMAGNLYDTDYDWTSTLAAWSTGNLISKKIDNYEKLINALSEEGVDIKIVDPNEVVEDTEEENSGSIFDVLSKAMSAMFSSFNNSWRRVMTGEEVDKKMEEPEKKWVDKVYGKKIVRPISKDGSTPMSNKFKAATYLFYVLDGSKEFFREYNIFQTYTGMEIPVDVVQNWVKNSEAWIVFGNKEAISYDENGAPDIQPIDPNDIQVYSIAEQADGLLGLQSEKADDKYTAEERAEMAENAKSDFEGYKEYEGESSGKFSLDAPTLTNSNGSLSLTGDKTQLIDTLINGFKGSDSEKYQKIFDLVKTGVTGSNLIGSIKTKDQLLDLIKGISYSDIIKLMVDNADAEDVAKIIKIASTVKNSNILNNQNGNGSKGGFGLSSRAFSNKRREELDKRFANIKAAADVSNTNARTMSQLVSAEDSTTSEMYNKFRSENREESVRKQFADMLSPTQVLMGMDGTYWVWDNVNTFHRYTYFGQDIAEELSNDEMMALYKNGRYLVEEKPISSIGRLQTTLNSNLTSVSSNFNTGLNSVSNTINYVTSYISGEASGSNIYTTGSSTSINTGSTSSSTKTPSLWDKIKQGASDIADKISTVVGKKTDTNTEDVTKKTKVAKTNKFQQTSKTPKTSKGGFGDRLNGVPYYSQNDSRWKNADYSGNNDNATMADAGCGPTVLSMVDNYFGGHETPTDYAKLAQDTGYRDETGTNWDFIGSATRAMGLNTSQVENPDALDIADQLSSGQPVILSGTRTMSPSDSPYTKSGHYVVATGLNSNGTVSISDPRGKSYSKAFPIDKLASDTGSMWGFGGKGGFGKLRKELVKRLDKKKKKKGGGRGKYSGDAARKVITDWISCLYGMVDYDNLYSPRWRNMEAAAKGQGRGITDCSGMQQWIYQTAMGVNIGDCTATQSRNGYRTVDQSSGDNYALPNFSALKPGDLIYFVSALDGQTMKHVEMYIGGTLALGIGSRTTAGSRWYDVNERISSGANMRITVNGQPAPQKYYCTKRIIEDGRTYDMNAPDPSWIKVDVSTGAATAASSGGSTDASTASSSSSTGSTTASVSTTKSAKSKDFFEVFSSLMGEVGNRYAKGVATGNFDTDFTAAFDEILNGGTTVVNSGGSSNSSDITGTYDTGGSYPNGGIYNGDYIGRYVKKYESGKDGSRSYGQCGNDWGRTWGSYGFTHHWGTAIKFLKKYYPQLAANLRYTDPRPDIRSEQWTSALSAYASSPDEVSAVWNKALETDGDANFFANEHQYAADFFYKPALDAIAGTGTKFNPDTHSRVAQESMWSWAIAEGGEHAGKDLFPDLGITDNNISVQDYVQRMYSKRQAKMASTSWGKNSKRYTDDPNPGNSEKTQMLQIADLKPFSMPTKSEVNKTPSKKPTLKSDDGTDIKENTIDDTSGKGGFGEGVTKNTLKKQANALLNRKNRMVHVTDPKTKAANLNDLISIQAKITSFENTEGDEKIGKELTKVSYSNTIPGSNGVKQTDVATGRGGFGDYIPHKCGGYGNEINNESTSERALNKLVNLVEAIVDYVSQSNNKLDYLKDIKNQQVVVKEGDKNIAVANTGSSYDGDIASNNKSLGRFLAEILASG